MRIPRYVPREVREEADRLSQAIPPDSHELHATIHRLLYGLHQEVYEALGEAGFDRPMQAQYFSLAVGANQRKERLEQLRREAAEIRRLSKDIASTAIRLAGLLERTERLNVNQPELWSITALLRAARYTPAPATASAPRLLNPIELPTVKELVRCLALAAKGMQHALPANLHAVISSQSRDPIYGYLRNLWSLLREYGEPVPKPSIPLARAMAATASIVKQCDEPEAENVYRLVLKSSAARTSPRPG